METVKIRAIVFEHPEPQIFGKFCGYCPATNNFEGRGNSIKDVLTIIRKHLYLDLCHRFKYKNLQNLGWEITNNSIKVPTFTDEEAVRLAEQSYEIKISNPIIIEIDVEVPPPTELY